MDIMVMNSIIFGAIIAGLLFVVILFDKYCNKLSNENLELRAALKRFEGEVYSDEESEAMEKELIDSRETIEKLSKDIAMYKDMIDDQIKIKETEETLKQIKKKTKVYKRNKIVKQIELDDSDYNEPVDKVLETFQNNPEVNTVMLTSSPRGIDSTYASDIAKEDKAYGKIVEELIKIGFDVGHTTEDGSKITVMDTNNLTVIDTYKKE